jgi:polysaccharide biosynthesis protein PslG
MLTPPSRDEWFKNYVATGGLQYADVVTFHGYFGIQCGVFPDAAHVADRVNNMQASMAAAGISGKPLWDTEASWGDEESNCFADQDQRAAFLAQFYLLHLSAGVSRFYWYQWNNTSWGTLWSPDPIPNGTVLPPGVAYQQIHNWLQDNTLAAPCKSSATQWTCTFTGDGGYQAEAIWDTSQSCSNGVCSTVKILVDSRYSKLQDLAGNSSSIPDRAVDIGIKPVWLSNQ